MAIYKVKWFAKFARKHRIGDRALAKAAEDVRDDRFDVDLGAGLYKQRVARQGGGKSGGFRTLITRRTSEHLFFVYGFPKNARSNIDLGEEQALKEMARDLGLLTQAQLAKLVVDGELEEIPDGDA
jgi:hypothetical protein